MSVLTNTTLKQCFSLFCKITCHKKDNSAKHILPTIHFLEKLLINTYHTKPELIVSKCSVFTSV